jgi:hypothetical protein
VPHHAPGAGNAPSNCADDANVPVTFDGSHRQPARRPKSREPFAEHKSRRGLRLHKATGRNPSDSSALAQVHASRVQLLMIGADYPRPLSAHERARSHRQRRLTLYLLLAMVALLLMIATGLWDQLGWASYRAGAPV